MRSERELAWSLVEATSKRFTATDRLHVYAPLGSGEGFQAITEVLSIVVRERYPLADELVQALTRWLDTYIGCEGEPATRALLSGISRCTTPDVNRDFPAQTVRLPAQAKALRPTDHDGAARRSVWASRPERQR
jgi:hypothetical protein